MSSTYKEQIQMKKILILGMMFFVITFMNCGKEPTPCKKNTFAGVWNSKTDTITTGNTDERNTSDHFFYVEPNCEGGVETLSIKVYGQSNIEIYDYQYAGEWLPNIWDHWLKIEYYSTLIVDGIETKQHYKVQFVADMNGDIFMKFFDPPDFERFGIFKMYNVENNL